MEQTAPRVAAPAVGPQPCAEPRDAAEKLAVEPFALPPQMPPEGNPAALTPQLNDRIMVVKPEWMERILCGDKTREVRAMRARPGPVWLGHEGKIYGQVTITDNCVMSEDEFCSRESEHRWPQHAPVPYARLCGLALSSPERLPQPLPYWRPGGAIGWNRYRTSKDDLLRKKARKGGALKEAAGEPADTKRSEREPGEKTPKAKRSSASPPDASPEAAS